MGDHQAPKGPDDGERECAANLEYLRRAVADMAPPVEYVTLADTGHYCGVRSFFGAGTVYSRPDMFDSFLKTVTDFLQRYSTEIEEH